MKWFVFVVLVITLCACHQQKKKPVLSNIIHPAPAVYIQKNDIALTSHQDTLFYNSKKFSGWLYLINGIDTILLDPYINGLKEGCARKWYDNKQLAEERLYIANRKEGVHRAWWPNGAKQYEFSISNDKYQGEFSEWNREGQLIKLFHYKDGQEEGSQQLWYDNGKTRANYFIVKGRRYGLLGTKNCTNVSDSVFKK